MAERTDQEIVDFYEARRGNDFFGVMGADLLATVSFEAAEPFLKDGVTADDWETEPREREAVIERMRSYMKFAWDKALGHRGLSAGRSIDHFRAWLFLLGDDELLAVADDRGQYPNYGAPILAAICRKYGFEIPERTAAERMAAGKTCQPGGCIEGCA